MLDDRPPCDCCINIRSYIADHLDRGGCIMRDNISAQDAFRLLKRCFPGEDLGIKIADLEAYIEECREEAASQRGELPS